MAAPGLTLCPEVNAVLTILLDGAQSVPGDHFSGLYLYGSLASGDFNPQTSDIEFLVVTDTDLPDPLIREPEAIDDSVARGAFEIDAAPGGVVQFDDVKVLALED